MSTVMDTVAGKGRNMGTNFWLIVLAVALVVFGANTGYATWKAAAPRRRQHRGPNLQLNSQRLANQGREAVEGKRESFAAFKATKAEDRRRHRAAQRATSATPPASSGPIDTVTDDLDAAGEERRPGDRQRGRGAGAGRQRRPLQPAGVPQLQAQLDEVVRAMSSERLAVVADLHRAAPERAGRQPWRAASPKSAPAAPAPRSPAEALARDAGVFEQVLTGLRKSGDQAMNVQALGNGAAVAALNQATTQWVGDEEGPRRDPRQLAEAVQRAGRGRRRSTTGSDKLLADSEDLFARVHRVRFAARTPASLGNIWISIVSGLAGAARRSSAWSSASTARSAQRYQTPRWNSTTATRRRSCACWTKWVRSPKATSR